MFRCSHPVAGLVESEVQGETAGHRSWKRKECRSTSGSRFKAASVRQYRFPRLSGKPIRDHEQGGHVRDRKSVGSGKSVSVSVDLVGSRIIKKKDNTRKTHQILILDYENRGRAENYSKLRKDKL